METERVTAVRPLAFLFLLPVLRPAPLRGPPWVVVKKFGEKLGHPEDFHKVCNGGGVLWLRARLVLVFAFVNGQVPCLVEEFAEASGAHGHIPLACEAGIFCDIDFPKLGFFHLNSMAPALRSC